MNCDHPKKRIAIFASGSGTNTEAIIKYFENNAEICVASIFSNNPEAYVLTRAKNHYIPAFTFNRSDLYKTNRVLNLLQAQKADYIVLAGFLWLIPTHLINNYKNRIINIHPALLPEYGGKGMYGDRVHQKVWENGEPETGISIHLVNEKYDEGKIIFQATTPIERDDTPEIIASKVHELEYQHYPRIIEQFIRSDV